MNKRSTQRLFFYLIGIIVMTFGIALTIHSQLGTSPFDALLVGLYRTFGLTIGSWEIVVGFSMILFNAIAEKKRPEYLALLTALLTGFFIDVWVFSTESLFTPETWGMQMFCLLMGLFFAGLGIAINLQADFAPNPFDRTMLVVKNLTGLNVSISRALISVVLVIIAFFFNGPIGLGTLIITLFSGVVIHFFMHYVSLFDDALTKKSSKEAGRVHSM
ncbi:YitT family protein [Halobacillus sp. A1]|uniref:YczE/YyaS/YitT family protein n=1 Tax=Halobacillus sp. A1 TaxID=2880262 RepID=UPI0020A692D9|nr:YitT family protein [Halobacillus sp. A1]MCP3031878.1 YitT family protein [Halobacillus sp. A1]